MEKKWNFKFPDSSPGLIGKFKFAVNRAGNNLKYGFDGAVTPLQLGPLLDYAKPVTKAESMLTTIMTSKDMLKIAYEACNDGRNILLDSRAKRKLISLSETKER